MAIDERSETSTHKLSDVRHGLSGIGHLTVGSLALVLFAGCLVSGEGERPPYIAEPGSEPCALTTATYRVASLDIPFANADARDVAFNLDFDESDRPDNAAGVLYAVLADQSDTAQADLTATIQQSLDSDEVIWVLQVSTCADSNESDGYAQVMATRARDADGDGRVELVGDTGVPAAGYMINDVILAQRGEGDAPVSSLVDVLGTETPLWGGARGLAVEFRLLDDGTASGRIGFGLPADQIQMVAPPLAAFFTTWLQADKSEFAAGADTDGDGVVSAAELQATTLYRSLFVPDVDLYATVDGDEVYWPGHDGVKEHLSFAARYTAVAVEVER